MSWRIQTNFYNTLYSEAMVKREIAAKNEQSNNRNKAAENTGPRVLENQPQPVEIEKNSTPAATKSGKEN